MMVMQMEYAVTKSYESIANNQKSQITGRFVLIEKKDSNQSFKRGETDNQDSRDFSAISAVQLSYIAKCASLLFW